VNHLNINLLPVEILEKRKAEKIISLIVIGMAVVFCCVFLSYLYTFSLVSGESGRLDELKAKNTQYEGEIAKIADYESNKLFVEQRQQLVEKAVASKYSWSKWLNNLSLLIPNEVWLKSVQVSGDGAVQFAGSAYADAESHNLGQKSVAKWLVRLTEINDLSNVWLEQSTKTEGEPREPGAASGSKTSSRDKIDFKVKAVLTPLAEKNSGSAPPTQGGS
jgi:Tfp pilus assembly protein PilN